MNYKEIPLPKTTKNLIGKIIGQWTVIRYDGVIKNCSGRGDSHWWCKCSCGFETSVIAQTLLNGTSTKCKTCAITKRTYVSNTIPDFYWRHIIKNAAKRGIEVLITKDECFKLLQEQNYKCALSKLDINLSTNCTEHLQKKTTASLDRIDSSKSYEVGNVQWLHKDVNMMKHIFDQSYFIEICKIITHQSSL